MKATILGLGEWCPPRRRANADWPAEIVDAWRQRAAQAAAAQAAAAQAASPTAAIDDGALTGRPDLGPADRLSATGFAADAEDPFLFARSRHVADPGVSAIEAAAHAGRAALADAGLAPADVDLVVTWDAIPDRPGCPGAPRVAHLLGAERAHGFDVQQACASVISSLDFAAALVESGRARHVLLIQTHIGFRFAGFEAPVTANVGDIATAMVVGPSERAGILAASLRSDGSLQNAVIIARGRDDESDTPWWKPGGQFYFGTKDRAGAQQMMRETVHMGALTIREACERARIDPSSIDVVCAPHPRRWIPGAIAQTLGLRDEQAPHRYEEIAHVGGCGTVANLLGARRRGLLREGSTVALYAQGQGMTRAAAMVSWGAR